MPQRKRAVNLQVLLLFGIAASIMITVTTALSLITTTNKVLSIRPDVLVLLLSSIYTSSTTLCGLLLPVVIN